MNENCKDCAYIQAIKDEIKNVKEDIKNIDDRLGEVEKFSASSGEQIKMIFKILSEIKDSIKDIGSKLGVLENRPGETLGKIAIAVITSACTGVIGYTLGQIFSKK